MRTRLISTVLGIAFAVPALALASGTASKDTGPTRSAAAAGTPLAGTWRSQPEEITLTTEFDESVWGKHARSVRTVDLAVRPTGEATLTVTRKVVDARGRTVKGSTSIEEAQLQLGSVTGSGTGTVGERSELQVAVTAAERRYPDDPGSRWPLDGLRINVAAFADDPATLEIRFDTPEGRGSFWEKVHRGTRTRTRTLSSSR